MSPFPATRRSLLARLGGAGGEDRDPAWGEFVRDYEAGLVRYARAKGLQEADARDVTQTVLLAVHRALNAPDDGTRPTFAAAGAFRGWLARVAYNKCVDAVRRRAARGKLGAPAGGTDALGALAALPDDPNSPADDPAGDWRRWAFCVAAGRVEAEVAPHTWAAFLATAVENRPAAEVAAELNLTVGAVYAAKCRTLARLRAVAATLSEEDAPDGTRGDDGVVGVGGGTR